MVILSGFRSARIAALALAAGTLGCGGADLTLPNDARPTRIEAVTGNAQAGIAGSALPLPLVIKVTDNLGRPVAGQSVDFSVTTGAGTVTPAGGETDTAGRASTVWTLGPGAGGQTVNARAVGRGAPDNLALDFTATAVAGDGSLLAAVSGDDQSAPVNSTLAESLVVRASDGTGNPVGGVTIQWMVQGGGSISPETVVTGDDGRAAAERVLGPAAGGQTAQASSDGLAGSPVTFVQTALPSAPTALTKVSGDGQSAPAGFEVAQDLVVRLTDADGNGVGGRPVTWVVGTGVGTPNPENSTTDPSGFARTRWTLGAAVGDNTMSAVFSGLPPVSFTANASSDVPSKLVLSAGDNQSGTVGQALASPLAVAVTDANDNPVENVSVGWAALGSGSVSAATSATDAQGIARISRTLGPTPGIYATTATVSGLAGSPVTFTSMAAAGAAAKLVVVTQPGGSAQNGAPISPGAVVQVQDAQGNNVATGGTAIAASLHNPPAGGTLGGTRSKNTDANGRAAFGDLSITGPIGDYQIQFTSGSLTAASATVTLTAGPVSAARSTVAAVPVSVPAGTSSTVTVTARDGGGNPIQGATVVLAATGSGNSLVQPAGPTDAGGVAGGTFTSSSAGGHTITASINGVAVSSKVAVTVTAGAVSASQSVVAAAPDPIKAGGAPATVTVTARDADGNPVAGATVVLAATGSGNTVGQPSGATNASGVITGTFTSTATGAHTISATIDGVKIVGEATVTVNAGVVSAGQSTVNADPKTVAAGAPATVTITARDASANPIQGATVVLSATGSGNTVGQPGGTTNGSGVVTATFASTSAGSHTITARINGVEITPKPVVTVTPGPANAAQSSVDANPGSIPSGGSSTITVTAHDAFGNPVQGAAVSISADGKGNTLAQPPPTNANGVTTGTFSSTGAGSHTISATVNGTGITDKVTVAVSAGPVSATQSSVSAAPAQIAAGGGPSAVTITARDGAGNPVSGATVVLTASGNSNTISAPALTDASGVTSASFTSTEAGSHVISATINTVPIAETAPVAVTAGPAASLQFTTQPSNTASNAIISPAPVVQVTDAFGNLTDATVHVDLVPGPFSNGTLAGTVDVASSGGSAVFSNLSVTSLGFYSLTASVGGQFSASSSSFTVAP